MEKYLQIGVWIWIAIGVITFFYLLKKTAPFGRHTTEGWGPMIDNRLGWVIMEIVSPIVFTLTFLHWTNEISFQKWLLVLLWNLHYFNRSFIFPLRIKTDGKKMPAAIMLSAVGFNVFNGTFNGYFLAKTDVNSSMVLFGAGFVIFIAGFAVNFIADHILINLRKPGETGYKIPKGFLFDFISCPNHFGEILEWAGFALMAWNIGGLSFFIWTIANLAPRAFDHHKWYLKKFEDYPKERKALIPFVI
jgi:hypothetical protein